MKKSVYSCILAMFGIVFFSIACGQMEGGTSPAKKFKTKSSKTFVVTEAHPQGQSLSDITVTLEGVPGSEMKFKDAEPVNKFAFPILLK